VATARLYERATGDDAYRSFATQQRGWVLGANPWGSSFVIGAGTVYPRCPEHQVDNLAGQGDVVGAVVNGPNAAELLDELNTFPTIKPCSSDPGRPFSDFDGKGSRYLDDVGAWQTVEPAIDFTANAVLAFGVSTR
jgi:endoglucanase